MFTGREAIFIIFWFFSKGCPNVTVTARRFGNGVLGVWKRGGLGGGVTSVGAEGGWWKVLGRKELGRVQRRRSRGAPRMLHSRGARG